MANRKPVTQFLFLVLNDESLKIALEWDQVRGESGLGERVDWGKSPLFLDRIEKLSQSLNAARPNILHIAGHGTDRELRLFDANNNRLSAGQLASMLKVRSIAPDLVFLNACYSATVAREIIPPAKCVICYPEAVEDAYARGIAHSFYRAVASGKTVREALDLAKADNISTRAAPLLLPENGGDFVLFPRDAATTSGPVPRIRMHHFLEPTSATAGADDKCAGRADKIAVLEAARTCGKPRIVMLAGPAGIGKTTIVRRWVRDVQETGTLKQLEQAFAWSFAGQGQPGMATGVSTFKAGGNPWTLDFLRAATAHFRDLGYADPGPVAPDQLGDELARAFAHAGGLMILDGIEPFQRLPGPEGLGDLLDKELRDFFQFLYVDEYHDGQPPWMLVLTSYWPLPTPQSDRYQVVPIEALSEADAADVLKTFRVGDGDGQRLHAQVAPEDEDNPGAVEQVFRDAARTVGCQPLALVLLASYLIRNHRGILRVHTREGRPEIDSVELHQAIMQDPYRQDRNEDHNRRLVDAWINLLSGKQGDSEAVRNRLAAMLELVRVLSLFEGPVSPRELDVIRLDEDRELEALTKCIRYKGLLVKAQRELVQHRILTESADYSLDFTHHLLRHQFADRFHDAEPRTWEAAHARLFAHYRDSARAMGLSDADEVRTLARATVHGCLSGREIKEAYRVCFEQLRTQEEGRASWQRVLARGDDLVLLSNFFQPPGWSRYRQGLELHQAGELFNETGYDLQKLGRFSESVEAFSAAVDLWSKLRKAAPSQVETDRYRLLLIRDLVLSVKGQVSCLALDEAQSYASEAVRLAREILTTRLGDLADLRGNESLRCMDAYSSLGWVEHMLNHEADSNDAFLTRLQIEDAAAKKQEKEKGYALIRTQKMFQHAAYLIDRGKLDEACKMIEGAQSICEKHVDAAPDPKEREARARSVAIDVAFNKLLMGKLYAARYASTRLNADLEQAQQVLKEAEKQCWAQDLLDGWLQAHLSFADLLIHAGRLKEARRHLDQAEPFATSLQATRFEVESSILRARLRYAESQGVTDPETEKRLLEEVRSLWGDARRRAQDRHYFWKLQEMHSKGLSALDGTDSQAAST